jgi:hypothetical protein
MAALLGCLLGFHGLCLAGSAQQRMESLWQLLQDVRKVHFPAKVKK